MGLISGLIQFFSVLFGFFQRIKIDQPENHVVMITGCDSGFGLLSVHRLLKLKYYVVALCLSEKGVAEIEEYCKSNGLSSRCLVLRCDVTKDADIQAVYERLNNLLQKNSSLKLWAIVNNAGIAPTGYTDWLSMDAFRKTMDVNYFSIIAITKAFLSLLKRAKYSRIINICSMAGQIGFAHGAAYCGSKHAVEGLTKCLRQELLLWNIFVTNINPAYMKTPILQTAEKLRLDEWNRAPKEITSQYPESVLAPAKELVEEDPQLVVDCIVDQLTVFMPTTNNYPGKVAKKYKWLLWLLPPIVLNAFEVLEVREISKGPYPDVVRQMQQN